MVCSFFVWLIIDSRLLIISVNSSLCGIFDNVAIFKWKSRHDFHFTPFAASFMAVSCFGKWYKRRWYIYSQLIFERLLTIITYPPWLRKGIHVCGATRCFAFLFGIWGHAWEVSKSRRITATGAVACQRLVVVFLSKAKVAYYTAGYWRHLSSVRYVCRRSVSSSEVSDR